MNHFAKAITFSFFLSSLCVPLCAQLKTAELTIKQTYDNGSVILLDTTFLITNDDQIEQLLEFFESQSPDVQQAYTLRRKGTGQATAPSYGFSGSNGEVSASVEDVRLILGFYPDGNYRGRGIRVRSIIAGTAAEGAGLERGDIITHVDGWEVANLNELRKLLHHFQMGEAVVIEYERDGRAYSGMGRLTSEDPDVQGSRSNQRYSLRPAAPAPPAPPAPPAAPSPPFDYSREKRVMLGVYPENLTRSRADRVDYPDTRGVYIEGLVSDGAAAFAGLRKGDIITRIDGYWIDNTDDLHNELKRYDPGDRVEVNIWRDGRSRTLVVQLKGKDGSYGPRTGRFDDDRPTYVEGRSNRIVIRPDNPRSDGKAYMGVYLGSSRNGAYLSGIVSGRPAERAGLRKGDIIIYMDGYEIDDNDDLRRVLQRSSPGDRLEIVFKRDRDEYETVIELGEKP